MCVVVFSVLYVLYVFFFYVIYPMNIGGGDTLKVPGSVTQAVITTVQKPLPGPEREAGQSELTHWGNNNGGWGGGRGPPPHPP